MSQEADTEDDRASAPPADRCSGLVITAVGAGAVALSLGLPLGSLARPASGTFPLLLGALLTALGLILTVQQLRAGPSFEALETLGRRHGVDLLLFVGLIIAYVLAFEPVGFILATAVLLAVMLWHYQRMPVWRSTLYALLLSGISYGLFNVVFRLRLPQGVFPGW